MLKNFFSYNETIEFYLQKYGSKPSPYFETRPIVEVEELKLDELSAVFPNQASPFYFQIGESPRQFPPATWYCYLKNSADLKKSHQNWVRLVNSEFGSEKVIEASNVWAASWTLEHSEIVLFTSKPDEEWKGDRFQNKPEVERLSQLRISTGFESGSGLYSRQKIFGFF